MSGRPITVKQSGCYQWKELHRCAFNFTWAEKPFLHMKYIKQMNGAWCLALGNFLSNACIKLETLCLEGVLSPTGVPKQEDPACRFLRSHLKNTGLSLEWAWHLRRQWRQTLSGLSPFSSNSDSWWTPAWQGLCPDSSASLAGTAKLRTRSVLEKCLFRGAI